MIVLLAKLKMGYMTMITPLIALDIVYLCAKFDYSNFSRSRYIIGAQNLKWVT